MTIWYILCSFGTLFKIYLSCTYQKNLATLTVTRFIWHVGWKFHDSCHKNSANILQLHRPNKEKIVSFRNVTKPAAKCCPIVCVPGFQTMSDFWDCTMSVDNCINKIFICICSGLPGANPTTSEFITLCIHRYNASVVVYRQKRFNNVCRICK
jgi:hypothetical protein